MFESLAELAHIQILPVDLYRLLSPLVYHSKLFGTIVAPHGYVTDLASVPRLPFAYLLAGGKASEAGIIHDWLYSSHQLTREQSDAVLREAIMVMGYSKTLANTMWLAVRVGGSSHWGDIPYDQPEHINNLWPIKYAQDY